MSLYPTPSPPATHEIETVVATIFPSTSLMVERVAEGVSTWVYRILSQNETFYLRILPEDDASFAPEMAAHTLLRRKQIKVPEIIHFEHCNDVLQRSIMVTSAIKGQSLKDSPSLSKEVRDAVVAEAGRDLAWINSLPIAGFGWVQRDSPETRQLRAQWPTYRAFLLEWWEADLAYLTKSTLSTSQVATLEHLISQYDVYLNSGDGCLAHGDFDSTHIYQDAGRYTGIIDFGEIRGADQWYDLGHFHLHDREQLPFRLEAALLRGYGEIISLPSDYQRRIRFTSVLINVRALARSLQKRPPNQYTRHLMDVLQQDMAFLR